MIDGVALVAWPACLLPVFLPVYSGFSAAWPVVPRRRRSCARTDNFFASAGRYFLGKRQFNTIF